MKRILIVVLLLGVLAGAVMLMARRTQPDWTTDSAAALAAFERGLDAQMKFYRYDAEAAYEEALEHDPGFVAAQLMLHQYERDEERRAELAAGLRAANLDRLSARERFMVRRALARVEGDLDEAERILTEYLEKYPKDPFALATCSNEAWVEGDWERAEEHYRRLLEVDPNWVAAQNHLGYIAMAQGRFEEAEELFETYHFIAPDQANPHDSMGELLTVLGRYDEAAAALERALEIKPDFCASYEHLFSLATLAGNGEAYPEIVGRAREHCGERMGEVMSCLAELWTDYLTRNLDGPWGEDREPCMKVYVREFFLLHRLAVLTGRTDTALELEELVRKRTEKGGGEAELSEAFLFHMKGVRALAGGELEEAISYLGKADRLLLYWGQGPAILKMFNQMNLAAALERAGKREEAEQVLARVAEVNPGFAAHYPAIRDELPGA